MIRLLLSLITTMTVAATLYVVVIAGTGSGSMAWLTAGVTGIIGGIASARRLE